MKIHSKVHSFRIYTSLVKICFKNKSCLDICMMSSCKKNEYNLSDYVQFFSNSSYLRINKGNCYISDGFLGLFNFYSDIIESVGICYEDRLKKSLNNNLFHLPEEKQILKDWLPSSILHVQGKYWVNDTLEDLKLIDAEAGEILWAIPQPVVEKPYGYQGLTNIKKVLGIYKENLWVQLPDSRVLALDVVTGKAKHKIVNEAYFCIDVNGISFGNNGLIYILGFDLFICFNLNTLSFLDELIFPDNIRVTNSKIIGSQELSFIAQKDGSSEPNAYGIFDTETQSITFLKEKEADMGYFYEAPQVNDEIFAILDDKGNLIIHKRKEMW